MTLRTTRPPLLRFRLDGTLGPDACRRFADDVDRAFESRGPVRALVDLTRVRGGFPGALWERDADPDRFGHVDRIALVGDSRWDPLMKRFTAPFTGARIRYFNTPAEAESWLEMDPR